MQVPARSPIAIPFQKNPLAKQRKICGRWRISKFWISKFTARPKTLGHGSSLRSRIGHRYFSTEKAPRAILLNRPRPQLGVATPTLFDSPIASQKYSRQTLLVCLVFCGRWGLGHELLSVLGWVHPVRTKYSRPRLTVALRHIPAFDSDFCTSKIMS